MCLGFSDVILTEGGDLVTSKARFEGFTRSIRLYENRVKSLVRECGRANSPVVISARNFLDLTGNLRGSKRLGSGSATVTNGG